MEDLKACCASCETKSSAPQNQNISKYLLYFSVILYFFGLAIDFEVLTWHFSPLLLDAIYLFCYIALGYNILKEAFLGFYQREWFNENSLMAMASIIAWLIGQSSEAVAILLFFRVGEALQGKIIENSKRKISSLSSLKIENAKILKDEKILEISPQEIKVNDILLISKGDRICADGVVIEGESLIDNSTLNGESLPRHIKVGDSLLSGGINLDNPIKIKATKAYKDSIFYKILELIKEGSLQKSKSEEFITKFARLYTPIITILAVLVMILPPLFMALLSDNFLSIFKEQFVIWLNRGLIFLVISCPCALVISIPLTFFASLGNASKYGILIKGSSYLESLFYVDSLIFDKTGTLTKGELKIESIHAYKDYSKEEILALAKLLESHSNHPIAKGILREKLETNITFSKLQSVKEITSGGVQSLLDGKILSLGNLRFINEFLTQKITKDDEEKCQVFLSLDGELIGKIILSDTIKSEAKEALDKLQSENKNIYMLSGDKESIAKNVAQTLNIKNYFAELLPTTKVEKLKEILKLAHLRHKKVAFIGDGINDAPSLNLSDIGIAMGRAGSEIALESADIVILDDNLTKIPQALNIAQRTRKILWENIIFALSIKVLILILGSFGIVNLWIALFGDVGVAILTLLNALRALR